MIDEKEARVARNLLTDRTCNNCGLVTRSSGKLFCFSMDAVMSGDNERVNFLNSTTKKHSCKFWMKEEK